MFGIKHQPGFFPLLLFSLVISLVKDSSGVVYLGCYKDQYTTSRLLFEFREFSESGMTVQFCLDTCTGKGYRYAGLEWSKECFCSNRRPSYKYLALDRECSYKCSGNKFENCGGDKRINVFDTKGEVVNAVADQYIGCFVDNPERVLRDERWDSFDLNSPEFCVGHCYRLGYLLAGLEAEKECYCGDFLKATVPKVSNDECSEPCTGEKSMYCGGQWRLSIYHTGITDEPIGDNFVGCFKDDALSVRLLTGEIMELPRTNTPRRCMNICRNSGYRFSGTKFRNECFCGNKMMPDGSEAEENECQLPCPGNPKEFCGGNIRVMVYTTGVPYRNNLVGCYRDDALQERLLIAKKTELHETNTPDKCMDICLNAGYSYAGTEFRYECFCGNKRPPEGTEGEENECLMPCPGNPNEFCGGSMRIMVYNIDAFKVAYMGCYKDLYGTARLLSQYKEVLEKKLTARACQDLCSRKGYRYAGVEWSKECFCSNERPSYKYLANEKDCSYKCSGNESEICGGDKRINVFDIKGGVVNAVADQYLGCFEDNPERVFKNEVLVSFDLNTPEFCVGHCYRNGYRFAGLEAEKECFCGDSIDNVPKKISSECSHSCTGMKSLKCGGKWRLSIYHTGIPDEPIKHSSTLGCYRDDTSNVKLLSAQKMDLFKTNTPRKCMNICFGAGFKFSGIENGFECYCGNKKPQKRTEIEEKECHLPCPGNSKELCGGNMKIMIYNTDYGSKKEMENNFHLSSPDLQNKKPQEPIKIPQNSHSPPAKCEPSETMVNGKPTCKGLLIFREEFEKPELDFQKWTHSVFMPWIPDYEFVLFSGNTENCNINGGSLVVSPTIQDDIVVRSGRINLQNCTGQPYSEECSRRAATFSILPPVKSCRISTKDFFSFQYGVIHIRAKLPLGEWIIPEIWLEPKRKFYGVGYASGRIRIAVARGNEHLRFRNKDIGNNRLKSGIMMGNNENIKEHSVIRDKTVGWHENFHNFTLIWTPDNFSFLVDGDNEQQLLSDKRSLCHSLDFKEEECLTWKDGTSIAPFDKEFYLSLGLSVGGMRDFPDGSVSGSQAKPWNNFEVKAMANFWKNKETWLPKWDPEQLPLKIDSIRIYSL